MADAQFVLIDGEWREAKAEGVFEAMNPITMEPTGEVFPVSSVEDVEEAVEAAAKASEELLGMESAKVAEFLDKFADRIEGRRGEIVAMAHAESGLPAETRLDGIELPRTTDQLRQAAQAAREGSWTQPTIDTQSGICSMFGPLEGGVAVFGPNNFPLAFNSVAGGDFAAAVGAGNPVVSKANSSHPGTTRLLAEEALEAVREVGLPEAMVQLIYRTDHETGKKLVGHAKIGATGYTGSRRAGLVLKEAADRVGKPIYLELSSINPVVILLGALEERSDEVAGEFQTSCLMGTGQFCTNPGLVLLLEGEATDRFIDAVAKGFSEAPVGTLLNEGVQKGMHASVGALSEAGAELVVGGSSGGGAGYSFQNTLLKVSAGRFLENSEKLQEEAFGNESLFVVAEDVGQIKEVMRSLEGNLTGCVYSNTEGADDASYDEVVPLLRRKVGRLLNDKMPTGVAVSAAMNHGGPYPATGHPGFTAVGIPASLVRFGMLQCFDNVRQHRLPVALRDKNPTGAMWRLIDGAWTQGDVTAA